MNSLTAEDARILATKRKELAESTKANEEIAKKAALKIQQKTDGEVVVRVLRNIWETRVREAINSTDINGKPCMKVEIFKGSFSMRNYNGLGSDLYKEFADELRELGYSVLTVRECSEDYGSPSDPDFFSPGRQEAYIVISWQELK